VKITFRRTEDNIKIFPYKRAISDYDFSRRTAFVGALGLERRSHGL